MDADPDLDLVVAELEGRGAGRRDDARRQGEAHRAALGVDLDGGGGTSASEPPASAWAPAIFSSEDGHADAATAGRVERVLDRDVVVRDDRRDLDLAGDELGGDLEVQTSPV